MDDRCRGNRCNTNDGHTNINDNHFIKINTMLIVVVVVLLLLLLPLIILMSNIISITMLMLTRVRPVHLLRVSLLRVRESNFPGDPLENSTDMRIPTP